MTPKNKKTNLHLRLILLHRNDITEYFKLLNKKVVPSHYHSPKSPKVSEKQLT